MTAKEYLEQAYRLEQQIDSKLEQVEMLRYLTTKTTAIIKGDSGSGGGENFIEDAIIQIVDLERDVAAEISRLTKLKREIAEIIGRVEDPEEKIVLEMRYLGNKKWPEIGRAMNCSGTTVYRWHQNALKKVEEFLKSVVNGSK